MSTSPQASPLQDTSIIQVYKNINEGFKATGQTPTGTLKLSSTGLTRAQEGANKLTGRDPKSLGMYAEFPSTTPKYMRHDNSPVLRPENFDTLARMHVRVKDAKKRERLLNSLDATHSRVLGERLFGETSKTSLGYVDFFITHVTMPLAEKYQVSELLADNYVAFFFGQQAPMFSYTGYVMNSWQDDWGMQMFKMYRDIIRGTHLARNGLLLYLRYNSVIISGYTTNLQLDLDAANEMVMPFTFQLLVKKVHVLHQGLTDPTNIPEGNSFLPAGYSLVETKDTGGKQTQVGAAESDKDINAEKAKTPAGTKPESKEVPMRETNNTTGVGGANVTRSSTKRILGPEFSY